MPVLLPVLKKKQYTWPVVPKIPQMEVLRTFDLLEYNLRREPLDIALAGKKDGEWITYSSAEYKEHADHVSFGLLELGLRPGDKVATITGNRPEWCFADMGLSQAGMIHVPVYPTIGSDEYEYILRHSGAKAIILSTAAIYKKVEAFLDKLPGKPLIFAFSDITGVKPFGELLELGKSARERHYQKVQEISQSVKPEDMVTLIYTSGTTGNSKGVMLSHRNLVSNFISTSTAHHIGLHARAASFLPLCHVYERMMNYHFQYKGISIYFIENMGNIAETLREIKPHIFNTVPRLLERIYDNILGKGKNLPAIKKRIFFWAINLGLTYQRTGNRWFYKKKLGLARRLVFSQWQEALGGELEVMVSGGAALQGRLEHIFWAAGLPVIQGYGLTETSPVIAVNPLRVPEIRFGTVGPALENVEVKIADDGEILCKGPNVMIGYYKDEERTREVIDEDGWFHTGDIGEMVEGHWLKITDRKKEMFKTSSGKYIAPQVIENKLKESFFIEQAMVIGENEKVPAALISPNFIFLHDWCSIHRVQYRDNQELIRTPEVIARYQREINQINKNLGEYEKIKRFRLVLEEWSSQTGEMSPTLKLKRKFLLDKYSGLIEDLYSRSSKEGNGHHGVITRLRNGISHVLHRLPRI